MKTKCITLIVISILICGCSTPYQPKGALGGYSSYQLSDNTYKVAFKGNQHTKAETVYSYLERRCAEITIDEGYKYFIIYEDSSYIDKTEFDNGASLDEQLDAFQNPMRVDNYLLDRKPEITRDPIEVILSDQHSKIVRTYSYNFIDSKATDVVGILKIQMFKEQKRGFEEHYLSAKQILEKYKTE